MRKTLFGIAAVVVLLGACKRPSSSVTSDAGVSLNAASIPALGPVMPRPTPPGPAPDKIEPPDGASKLLGMSVADATPLKPASVTLLVDGVDGRKLVRGFEVRGLDDAKLHAMTAPWGPPGLELRARTKGGPKLPVWYGKTFTAISMGLDSSGTTVRFNLPADKAFWGETAVPPLGLAKMVTGTAPADVEPSALRRTEIDSPQGMQVRAEMEKSFGEDEALGFLELSSGEYSFRELGARLTTFWGPPPISSSNLGDAVFFAWTNASAGWQASLDCADWECHSAKLRFVSYAPIERYLGATGDLSMVAESIRLLAIPTDMYSKDERRRDGGKQEPSRAWLPSASPAAFDAPSPTLRETFDPIGATKPSWVTYRFRVGRSKPAVDALVAAIDKAYGPSIGKAALLDWAPSKSFARTSEDYAGGAVYRVGKLLVAVKSDNADVSVRLKPQ